LINSCSANIALVQIQNKGSHNGCTASLYFNNGVLLLLALAHFTHTDIALCFVPIATHHGESRDVEMHGVNTEAI